MGAGGRDHIIGARGGAAARTLRLLAWLARAWRLDELIEAAGVASLARLPLRCLRRRRRR